MKKLNIYKKIFTLLVCMALFLSCCTPAFADSGDGVLDEAALQKMLEDFISENGLDPKNFAVGYVYTGTGEEWYYNGDTWFYPASMYKVPLMMMLAEKVAAGELEQDSDLGGYTVALAEEYIISYSNNDYAHYVRTYLGGDEEWRQHAKSYTTLEDDYYSPDYMDYCYFSPRYITQVVKTLYNESQRFPNIIECMLVARPTHDYRLSDYMNNTYSVAQKYGSYCDNFGDNFNHNTGIIYTPTPFVLTVMTLNVSNYEKVISDVALLFTEYTLSLEDDLVVYEEEQAEQAEQEAIAAAEAEKKAAEEKAAAEKAEAQRLAEEQAEAERLEKEAQQRKKLVTLGLIAGLAVILIVLVLILVSRAKKRRRYAEYEERFRREMQYRNRY